MRSSSVCDPYAEIRECVVKAVARAAEELGLGVDPRTVGSLLQEPPKPEFGDLALPLPRVSRQLVERCAELAPLAEDIGGECVERVECVGGYMNIRLRSGYLVGRLAEALSKCGSSYGIARRDKPLRVLVEFVSANPIHPLHIGSGRNAALGDFVARAHELLGDVVERRYYVNDLGLQVAYLVYGYAKLGRPKCPPQMKDDHLLGLIYAAAYTVADISRLKKRMESASEAEARELRRELDSLVADLLRIRERVPGLVDELLRAAEAASEDVEREVRELSRALELGDPSLAELHGEVIGRVVSGIRATLERLGISFDRWDYESELVRSGLVDELLARARKSEFFTYHKGAPALDVGRLAERPEIREALAVSKSMEIPPLVLARSDGTTLYTTRDLAYTLKKFSESGADLVYNVVAVEQTLPQAQLRLALYALGYEREARSLVHYAYEMVNVKGLAMSGRRARYVTVDEVLDALVARARSLARERGVEISDEAALKIARSALRYVMLSVSPRKTLVFDLDQAVGVKAGTATYLQYTLARARSILSKYGREIEFSRVGADGLSGKRRELALLIARFPEVFRRVATELTPEDMVSYLNRLAEVFNPWYDSDPVLAEPDESLRNLKLMLVYGTKTVIENSFRLLGLDALERV